MKGLKYIYYVIAGLVFIGSIQNILDGLFDIYGFINLVAYILGVYLIYNEEK